MPDIIITPSSGLIDFFPVSTRVGRIEGSGNTINVLNPSGYVAVSGSGMSINTSSPNALLHAYSSISGATILNLEGTNGSLFSVVDNLSGSLMSVNNNAGLPVFEVFSDDRVIAGRFNLNDFIITSGGNIGIGTGVPSSKFHVVGTSTFNGDVSSTGSIIAGSGSAANPSFEFVGDIDTGIFAPAANTIALSTSGVERVRIDNIGRVGIGTSSPTQPLDVSGTIRSYVGDSSLTFLTERTGVTSGGMGIDFSLGYTNIKSLNSIRLLTGSTTAGTARLFIDSSNGNIGIGTTTPSSQLHVVGSGIFTSGLFVTGVLTSNTGNFVGSLSSAGNNKFYYNGDNVNNEFAIYSSTIANSNIGNKFKIIPSGTNYGTNITLISNPNSNNQIIYLPTYNDGTLALTSDINTTQITGILSVSKGGTNTSAYSNGQLLIGSGTSLIANTLTASTGISITNGSGTITIATTGLANYDVSVLSLGIVSGSNAINCGQDRQIQNLTLNGVATTFTKGNGWPTSDSVARETTLNIFASGNTSVTWTIVNDWYRQPDSPLPSGRHIVLLRSIGSGTMQGHYIGNKTN